MIPLLVDLSARCVLICGGGEVAARKAAFFLPEAEVTVVSRSFSSTLSARGRGWSRPTWTGSTTPGSARSAPAPDSSVRPRRIRR